MPYTRLSSLRGHGRLSSGSTGQKEFQLRWDGSGKQGGQVGPPQPESGPQMIIQLISGGQTGVDRAALEAALESGFPCGGWCPRGRRAEDGRLPARFPLKEAPSARYAQRTALNVRDSDGTLVLTRGRPDRGTALTCRLARQRDKPLLIVDLERSVPQDAAAATLDWAVGHCVEVLNVAGPRESHRPGVHRQARRVLDALIEQVLA